MKALRILIADDHGLMRAGTRALIESQPDWQVCGEASDGRKAVSMVESLKPDVAVLDLSMPELNGLEAVRQIRQRSPHTEVLIYTGHESEELILDVFEAGAKSYIRKTDSNELLISAIQALAEHKPFFSSKVSEVVFARFMQNGLRTPGEDRQKSQLTGRERELVQLLAEGRSNKEAATTLGISVKTIETHRAMVMKKLHLESFSELIRYAIRSRIIDA